MAYDINSMQRKDMLELIWLTSIKLKGKLLMLSDNYEAYHSNYSSQALALFNEYSPFSDAVDVVFYSSKYENEFNLLDDNNLREMTELSLRISDLYGLEISISQDNNITKEIDFSLYKKSWIVVRNLQNEIERVIYNEGNGITFVNEYGEIIEEIPFDTAYKKTEFLNKYLNIKDSNSLLITTGYTYKAGFFVGGNNSKRSFDLQGNEASLSFKCRNICEINQKNKESKKQKSISVTQKKSVTNSVSKEPISKTKNEVLQTNIISGYPSFESSIIWNKEKMGEENMFAESVNNTKCNLFLPKYLKSISDKVYNDIITEENAKAKRLYELFEKNEKLYKIQGSEYDVVDRIPKLNRQGKLFVEQKKEYSAAKKAIIAQDFANASKIVIAYATDHVAIVTKQDTMYSSYPETNWNKDSNAHPFQDGNGYSKGAVLDGFPVFLQSGSYTGVVNPGMAMGRNAFNNDEVKYYVYKG